MSIRYNVPTFPQLSVNPTSQHHHPQRVQPLPVSVATIQQQISHQQQPPQPGSAQNSQNGGGNVQAAPAHPEFHIMPFQAAAGANIAQNYIRHMPNGGYTQPHQQSQALYQTQGPPGVVQSQQSQQNPAQPLPNAVPQNQARLTPMTQHPTAPPTPPTQQQQPPQQQSQGGQQFAVQLPQQGIPSAGAGGGNPRSAQYRPQNQQRRNPHQQQQYIYGMPGGLPYGYVTLPQGPHVRPNFFTPYMQPQVYNHQFVTASYGQLPPQSNGQPRQSAQPQAVAPTMAQPQANEYQYTNMEVYQQAVIQPTGVPPQQAPPPVQKTVRKPRANAIQIINPYTRKNILEDDSGAGAASDGSAASTAAGSGATVDKAITASHNELNKDEAVDKDATGSPESSAEPSTPVVSAISDGPSVDITPKHQVKTKKVKPPEPAAPPAAPVATPSAPSPPIQQIESPKTIAEPKPVVNVAPVAVLAVTNLPQDCENNNSNNSSTTTTAAPPAAPAAPVPTEPVIEQEEEAPVSLDVNDNYQKEEEEKAIASQPLPQDSNNNTDDKSIMTSPSIRAAPQDQQPTPPVQHQSQPQQQPQPETKSQPPSRKISVIDYDDGQWSPENLSGKKYYTRDQLLKLKDQPIAAMAPEKLPENVASTLMKNNKETLMNTLTQTMPPPNLGGAGGSMQRGPGNMPFDPYNALAPKFAKMDRHNLYQKRPSQGGNKPQPHSGRGSQQGIIKVHLNVHDDVKLNEAQNAWKPSHLVPNANSPEEDTETGKLLNRFRSMLNKLTAENFDVLVQQVKTYKIDTSERLDGVIKLIFEKAISEPKFAPTYAKLCKEVASISTANAPQDDQQASAGQKKNNLKVLLITQCQREFERHREESKFFNEIEEKLREIESQPASGSREEEKARLEEDHYRMRQRANGTVKFIGELFKIDMLTLKIMRSCIDMLLQETTEEKIERVCKLLTTIGGKMEASEGPSSLDQFFRRLKDILNSPQKIIKSSRIRFEIQNLQDLRNNNWKARRADLTPKTLDQIQVETERELQMQNYQNRSNKDDRNRNYNNNNNNNRRGGQQQQDNDGWSVQSNKNSRSQPIALKNFVMPPINKDGAQLGGPANFQSFMAMQNQNKYAALPLDTESDGPPRFGGSGSKNSSMERGGSRYYDRNGGGNAPYSGRSSGSRNSSQNRSRDNSDVRGGPSRSLQAPPKLSQQGPPPSSSMSFSGAVKQPQKSSPPMSEEEVKKNFDVLLKITDKYRDDKLTTEMAMKEIRPLSVNDKVMVEIYNVYVDRKDKDRENLMIIVIEMLKDKKITREENCAALKETMAFAEDMICDVPRVYEYIAQYLAELLIASVITFQEVYQICESEIKQRGENLLRYIFTAIEKSNSSGNLRKIVDASNCDLGKFTSDGNLNRWLENNKFKGMEQGGSRDILGTVKQMLEATPKASYEEIMNVINSSNCEPDAKFIYNLTKVVIENCCEEYPGSIKLKAERLEDMHQLLQRYIDNKADLELVCIDALNNFALDKEYPPGLLNSMFEILYDNDVLTGESFFKWKDSGEGKQGKGVAVCSTRQFFIKLEENKDDDECDYEGES